MPARAEAVRRPPPRLPSDRALGASERARLVGEILAAYLGVRRALRHEQIAAVVARMRARRRAPSEEVGAQADPWVVVEASRLGRAVERTLALVPGDTRCLVRSLVLTRLLTRREIPAKLVIGARAAPDFLAHAWVECWGRPVLDPGEEIFGRLVEL